ncbi:DUF7535 family protein [Halomicrobium urmianum]|uniref:DUF7535 family protein n=1 Tax=Halomicrobium urmianum TaxID=1586233 RepID=UPI001CD93522|nr:hypothetical protein [Halomicrobium urmianum]
MSAASEDDSVLRTVTPLSDEHLDSQMGAFGYIMAGLLVVILLPLLPVAVLIWIVSRVLG